MPGQILKHVRQICDCVGQLPTIDETLGIGTICQCDRCGAQHILSESYKETAPYWMRLLEAEYLPSTGTFLYERLCRR